ncbi:hypothetical protein QE152_g15961 [Popillia japonica]|uniref:Uncharacterized protein n=1 Tax=Popillia japonica TaxID=7064 RepID=A0AAW1L6G7_POPJA
MNQGECTQSAEQRALVGTWLIGEVRTAIEKGYSMLEIYEASGWPTGCDSADDKEKYIQQYLEKEGIQLNPNKIEKNPGLRQVGKAVITSFWGKLGQRENQAQTTIVNEPTITSFWGKLGQRENQAQTTIVNEPTQFFVMLNNPGINLNTVQIINDSTLVVNWEHKEKVYHPLPTANVCLAAYTTAQARLKLYFYLEKLGERVL